MVIIGGTLSGKRHKRAFWGAGNVLCLDWVMLTQVNTYVKIHQAGKFNVSSLLHIRYTSRKYFWRFIFSLFLIYLSWFCSGHQNPQLNKLATFPNSPAVGMAVTQFWRMRLSEREMDKTGNQGCPLASHCLKLKQFG